MDQIPIELIHYILYDPIINLKWITVKKCLKTSKIFQVLNKRELSILSNTNKGYEHCITVGDLNALQRSKINDEYSAFLLSCSHGRLKICKWLINTYPKIDIHMNEEEALKKSCEFDHLKIVKWLIEYGNAIGFPIDIHAYDVHNTNIFELNCEYGNIEIIQWLIENANTINSPFDKNTHDNDIWYSLCTFEDIEMIHWLINYSKLIGSPIDQNKLKSLFSECCWCERTHIAQWLYEYSKLIGSPIDIHANNDYIYMDNYLCGNRYTVRWLYEYSKLIGSPTEMHDKQTYNEIIQWLYKEEKYNSYDKREIKVNIKKIFDVTKQIFNIFNRTLTILNRFGITI